MFGLVVTIDGLLEISGEGAVAALEPAQVQVQHLRAGIAGQDPKKIELMDPDPPWEGDPGFVILTNLKLRSNYSSSKMFFFLTFFTFTHLRTLGRTRF